MAVKQVKKAAEVTAVFEISEEQWNKFVERLHKLEVAMAEAEKAVPVAKKSGREWTPEERKAAGLRLQTARAIKLGLESAEQMRSLKLRPGQKPTAAQINQAKKQFPVMKVTKVAEVEATEAEAAK